MATAAEWIEGARPRTLPAAVSPVLAGTGLAIAADSFVWWKALLALIVALALQIGVNYANDYSDGVRGTDAVRVGPLRLVGSGVASPASVKQAAYASFAVAAVVGFTLAATTAWWLIAVGAVCIVAAWFYTGGSRPYGYRALGEVSVFVFFGLVAVLGTVYVQTEHIDTSDVWAACGIGSLACAILVANNLRDIPTDRETGKRTLAVVMGDQGSRDLFTSLHGVAFAFLVLIAADLTPWALGGLIAAPLSIRAVVVVRRGAVGPALIAALRDTGLAELLYAVGLLAGLVVYRVA
ncbi:MAG TPA: 1,4-dihydroxy-2-naphthoate polyprenyltransferase [Nocardioidaceae bacterium]|nr:1,4-dihydroxy-2-naphthoate polyprenyltransferase [Nocardioidaceae bacterium]